MCCHTNQCCCGCMPLKKGIILAASIDIIFHIFLGLVNFTFLQNQYLFGEYILVVADILLICGVNGNNGTLMVFWLVICMITIVLLFIGWIVIPVVIFLVGMCKTANSDSDFWYEKNTDYFTTATRTFCADEIQIKMLVVVGVFVYALPIYYLYLWIVVKSHRKDLIEQQASIQPASEYRGQPIFVSGNNGASRPHLPHQPQVLPEPNPTMLYYQPTPLPPPYVDTTRQQLYSTKYGGLYGK